MTDPNQLWQSKPSPKGASLTVTFLESAGVLVSLRGQAIGTAPDGKPIRFADVLISQILHAAPASVRDILASTANWCRFYDAELAEQVPDMMAALLGLPAAPAPAALPSKPGLN